MQALTIFRLLTAVFFILSISGQFRSIDARDVIRVTPKSSSNSIPWKKQPGKSPSVPSQHRGDKYGTSHKTHDTKKPERYFGSNIFNQQISCVSRERQSGKTMKQALAICDPPKKHL
ncbi:hypothetical protein GJ496_004159 [Pomphorhynchus laevis]|nr:hypothetical protein GJ496_004159 [Pomphorhynchus laevis]